VLAVKILESLKHPFLQTGNFLADVVIYQRL